MADSVAKACGKIILTGEYAVLFGYPGIAMPAPLAVEVSFHEDESKQNVEFRIQNLEFCIKWQEYIQNIINLCTEIQPIPPGTLTIQCDIPLGKGMGSSTALVIAITKCLLGNECQADALSIEDTINPGHSGLDFAVIWHQQPVKCTKGEEPELLNLNVNLHGAILIDTGEPGEPTPALISWVSSRKEDRAEALKTIGSCSDRLLQGEDLSSVIRDHHQAQCALGIVTPEAKELITKIEQYGGAAKVIGAGSRTGGCGMILAVNCSASSIDSRYPVYPL